jgi:predicted RNase H-like HicB family nuclease
MPVNHKVVLVLTEEGYSAHCPDLPGCWSQGQADREALDNIYSAIEEYQAVIKEAGRPS